MRSDTVQKSSAVRETGFSSEAATTVVFSRKRSEKDSKFEKRAGGFKMSVQLTILVGYVILLSFISWIATRIQRSGKGGALDYLLAGRHLPTPLVAAMLTGLAIGGASTVGVAENAYVRGLSAGWYNAAWGAAGILVGLFAAKHFRKMNVRTVPEMMGRMFGQGARTVGVIAQLLILMVITALQYVAGGAILTALLPDIFTFQTGMFASALIFIFITVVGGYWAGGLTNVVNVIVIYVGIFAALHGSSASFGGWDTIIAALPAGKPWFDWTSGVGTAVVTAWMVVMITQGFSVQAINQIAFAAKDEKTARNGFILGGILILPAGFLCALFGIIAASQFPGLEKPALALPSIAAHISPLVGGLFLASLWAADISTAVGLLLGSSTLIVEDIWKRFFPGTIAPDREVFVSRMVVLAVSICTFLMALTVRGILVTITTALAITASFTLLILAGIYTPGLCKRIAGFWTISASILVWLAWTFVPAIRVVPHLAYLEWPICLAVFLLCAVLGKEPAKSLLVSETA